MKHYYSKRKIDRHFKDLKDFYNDRLDFLYIQGSECLKEYDIDGYNEISDEVDVYLHKLELVEEIISYLKTI